MKKIRIIIFLFCFFLSGLSWAAEIPAGTYELSLQEALDTAFKNNRQIKLAQEDVNAAEGGFLEAKSAFLPKLTGSLGYTRNGGVLSIPLTVETKKDLGVFTGYRNDNQAALQLDQAIYSGGANYAGLRQKRTQLEAQKQALRAKKLDIEFEVKRLYHGLQLAKETLRIAQELLDQAKSHFEQVDKRYQLGEVSRFDRLQSQVQVSKLEPELIKAKNALDLTEAELKKLLGLKMRDNLKLKDTFGYAPLEIKEEAFLQAAYLEKPEMIIMSLDIDVTKWGLEIARAYGRPQVEAAVGTLYRSDDPGNMFNSRHNNWQAGVSVKIPIFDGFSTRAKVEQARARYQQARIQKEDFSEQVAVDIRKACLDLSKSAALISSQKDSIGQAQEALRIAQVSYENGQATNLDVLDAQVSLSQVQENLSEAIYDYLMAQAYLSRTMGKSSVDEAAKAKEKINEKTAA